MESVSDRNSYINPNRFSHHPLNIYSYFFPNQYQDGYLHSDTH